jgi:hypothetical protein
MTFWILVSGAAFGFSIGRIKSMSIFLFALCALLHALCILAEAQQPRGRIGIARERG